MSTMTYREAVRAALRDALTADPRIFLMGEDVGRYGGAFACSRGLLEEFGPERVRDTPLSESTFVGAGIGAALGGMRPIVEVMTVNFSMLALDQVVNNAATLRHMSGGQLSVPLVVRMTTGGGRRVAAQHSNSLECWYAHIPGIKVVAPATVHDVRGGHDMVVAGTRGLSAPRRFLVGSTAERLVRKCPCPVWIAKKGHEGPPRSVLVPVDFSAASGKSLALAATLAERFSAALRVLHVLTRADEQQVPVKKQREGLEVCVPRREVRRVAATHLRTFASDHAPGASVHELVAAGIPWQRIIQMARRRDIDLIVMASVGRTGIPGFFIGSTAEKVLRQGDHPILTVKPDGFVSPVL